MKNRSSAWTAAKFLSCIFGILSMFLVAGRGTAMASDATEAQGIVDKAKVTFTDFMADKNYSWLHENLHRAKGLLIYPQVLKAGFIFGGSGGTGLLVVRDDNTGEWCQPAFYTVGSVTFGLQIGAEASELIVMVMSKQAIDSLLSSSLRFGGDASIAFGPVGVGAKGDVVTDLIAFAKAKGLYGGLNLEGSLVQVRSSLNSAFYRKDVTPVDIVVRKTASNPESAPLLNALKKTNK